MKVSEAFADGGITPVPTERQFRVTCDECGTEQHLDTMPLSDVAGVTIYSCGKCGRSLAGVKPFKPDAQARESSGYRLKANVVGNRVDLYCDVAPGRPPVLMPATPVFFE